MRIARWLFALGIAGGLPAGGPLLHLLEPPSTYADEKADSKEADARRHFDTRIAPLLARHCLECHDSAAKKGGLDLSRRDAAGKGGDSGEVIVPGKADESLLWQYVEVDEMPPNRQALSAEEKRDLCGNGSMPARSGRWQRSTRPPIALPFIKRVESLERRSHEDARGRLLPAAAR